MEKEALRIIQTLANLNYTDEDLKYLAWYTVYNSNEQVQRRLRIYAEQILKDLDSQNL